MNVSLQICTILFYFLFLISRYNLHCLDIFIIFSFGIFIIIILIRIWFINYYQEQIVILRGVLDEVDDILVEVSGDKGYRIIVLLPHWRLADGHTPPINSFLPLKIYRVDGIYYTIIIILEL